MTQMVPDGKEGFNEGTCPCVRLTRASIWAHLGHLWLLPFLLRVSVPLWLSEKG